jgi:branched-chain amino acid transport system permease protein
MKEQLAALRDKISGLYERFKIPLGIALFLALIIFPYATKNNYLRGVVIKMLMYTLMASSVNVINGYSGQFTIGQAGFICVGAYTAAKLMTELGCNFFIALLAAGIIAAIFGVMVSYPTRKLSGIYLTIVTLGFSEIIRIICLNWVSVTGGPMGIKMIPSPSFFGIPMRTSQHFYYIILALCIIMIFCTKRVLASRIGRAWMSIRENQEAASSLGIENFKYKAINFAYGSFWAGVSGAFLASYYHYVDSTMFAMDEGFNIISMAVLGGMGTLIGPIIGAFIVNFITEAFRFVSEYRLVVYALLIIIMMWVRPQGLLGASDSVLAYVKADKEARKIRKAGSI